MFKKLLLAAGITAITACSHSNVDSNSVSILVEPSTIKTSIQTMYDYQLIDRKDNTVINFTQLVNQLTTKNVIFIGEHHSHQASHLLQLQLIQALYQRNPNLVISMEQFTRDSQEVVDKYLASNYGEATLIEDGNAWDHYKGSYRAVLEFARVNDIQVIAANAPAMHVRCVGKKGLTVLDQLPNNERLWSSSHVDINNKAYQDKFFEFMKGAGNSHGQTPEEQKASMMKTFAAQLLRDTTMAESIDKAYISKPNTQVIHLNGAFHSDGYMGTVAVLQHLKPSLNISVLSPVSVELGPTKTLTEKERAQGDYLYLIANLPERYLDKDKRKQSIKKLIKKRMSEQCEIN